MGDEVREGAADVDADADPGGGGAWHEAASNAMPGGRGNGFLDQCWARFVLRARSLCAHMPTVDELLRHPLTRGLTLVAGPWDARSAASVVIVDAIADLGRAAEGAVALLTPSASSVALGLPARRRAGDRGDAAAGGAGRLRGGDDVGHGDPAGGPDARGAADDRGVGRPDGAGVRAGAADPGRSGRRAEPVAGRGARDRGGGGRRDRGGAGGGGRDGRLDVRAAPPRRARRSRCRWSPTAARTASSAPSATTTRR